MSQAKRKDKKMEIKQDFSTDELFIIKSALHLLAEKTQIEGDIFGDFDTIAELEKSFVIAYYEKVGA